MQATPQQVIIGVLGVVVCLAIVQALSKRSRAREEGYTNMQITPMPHRDMPIAQKSLHGELSPAVALLQGDVAVQRPSVWLTGSSLLKGTWLDASGNSNHVQDLEGVRQSRQKVGDNGCNAAFDYVQGSKGDTLKLVDGWPAARGYTFFHVTRYGGTLNQNRIWTAPSTGGVNWLSGHHGGRSGSEHANQWIKQGSKIGDGTQWLLTASQSELSRSKLSGEGRQSARIKNNAFRPPVSIGINTYPNPHGSELSDWACAEVIIFDKVLTGPELRAVEIYLEAKYGFV